MTENKAAVPRYMDGFDRSDHEAILAYRTDDVEWIIPGMFRVTGKVAFDREIENDAFVGRPDIRVDRLVEEAGVVVAEGRVTARKRDGGTMELVFCDVFEMAGGRIRKLISYLMEVKA
jgi:ketosteroid isomerase-like protein